MRRLLLVCMIQCFVLCAFAQQLEYKVPKHNQKDEKGRKQGLWMEEVGEIRGEPGFTWEGVYKNDRKDGKWTKSTHSGILLAEETYKNNALNGYCKYFYPDGKKSAEGLIVSSEIPGQKDTIAVIDLETGNETMKEIVREGNPVRQGLWKVYDEETGKMSKEYYRLGEIIPASEAGDNDSIPVSVAPKAPVSQLPHEAAAGGKKKH
ncbi:toxin-antitoxin system YwqK family antitoxin [Chitinophaga sp. Hz27]|uniref:toxin-antitoxin system YwqK family antitoxin n=1 Tax=Chitinophaga sp. Hz27 TaxID=3347169 RepID=UPI0035DF502D